MSGCRRCSDPTPASTAPRNPCSCRAKARTQQAAPGFTQGKLELDRGGAPQRQARAALAEVRYDDDPARRSLILYLKPTMAADDPVDVREYHARNDAFPQQTTVDQFFDEAQWESYRKLGEVIGRQIFTSGSSFDDWLARLAALPLRRSRKPALDGRSTTAFAARLEGLARDQQLSIYRHDGFWQPMDTLRDKNYLDQLWQSGKAPWKTW